MSSPLAGALMMTFWAPASMCALAFVGVGEDAGALEDDVDAEVAPRQGRRVLLGQDLDLAPVDDDRAVAGLDLAVVGAVRRVVLEQQGVHLGVDEVVDRHDLDVRGALDERLERLAADAAEAVDADAGGHRVDLLRDARRRRRTLGGPWIGRHGSTRRRIRTRRRRGPTSRAAGLRTVRSAGRRAPAEPGHGKTPAVAGRGSCVAS